MFDPATLVDGIYTLRLRAFHNSGATFNDQIQIRVRYLEITSPVPPPVPSVTQVVKPGAALQISGQATGSSFQSYKLDWASGQAAKAASGMAEA